MQNEGVVSQRKTICGYGNVKHLRRKVIIPDVAINEIWSLVYYNMLLPLNLDLNNSLENSNA